MSLVAGGDHSISHVYGVYLGARTFRHLDAYVDIEMARGKGIYYCVQAGPWVQVSPDIQYIRNPGYNRDRGPARVLSLRMNMRY